VARYNTGRVCDLVYILIKFFLCFEPVVLNDLFSFSSHILFYGPEAIGRFVNLLQVRLFRLVAVKQNPFCYRSIASITSPSLDSHIIGFNPCNRIFKVETFI